MKVLTFGCHCVSANSHFCFAFLQELLPHGKNVKQGFLYNNVAIIKFYYLTLKNLLPPTQRETLGCSCDPVQYKERVRGFCVAVRVLRIMYCGFHRDLSGPLGMSGKSHRKPCGCNRTFSTARLPGTRCWGNHVYRNCIYTF